jgi:hypothetical protein
MDEEMSKTQARRLIPKLCICRQSLSHADRRGGIHNQTELYIQEGPEVQGLLPAKTSTS